MDLCCHFPECRKVFDSVERRDQNLEDPLPTSQIFFPPPEFPEKVRSKLNKRLASPRIDDAQTPNNPELRNIASFGVFLGNWTGWQLFRELNIIPDFMFGLSLGEMSALCAAGAIDFYDFVSIYWQVAFSPSDYNRKGRLVLVSASAECLAPFLADFPDVNIAIHVAPEFQIMGGEVGQIKEIVSTLRQEGIWTQMLPYPAIHTPRLTTLRPRMEPALQKIPITDFKIPVYSGMTCDRYPENADAVRQTMIANIDHPVLGWQTTRKLYEDGMRVLIQVGGGSTWYSQAKTNIDRDDVVALSLDVDYRSAIVQLHHLCAELLVTGIDVRIEHLYEHCGLDLSEVNDFFSETEGKLDEDTDESVPRMPFMGKILAHIEGSEIVMERVLDLRRDIFLRDHVFINAGSVKPDSACLPVVPMTVSLEMMAEAAACLAPGCGLTGFEAVSASRWIALVDSDRLVIQISARHYHVDQATGIHRVAAAIFTPDNRKPAIQATVLLGQRYVEQVLPEFSEIKHPERYPFGEDEVYQERYLFHGPAFQCIKGKTALTGQTVIGTLCVLSKQAVFSDLSDPQLLCDPMLLDGVGQLVGLWAIDKGEYVFPVGIKKLEIYGPTPPVGTRVPVLVEIKEHSNRLLIADIEIQDGEGRVWMRIHQWKDWVFHWSESFNSFRRWPNSCLASHALSRLDLPEDAVVRYIFRSDVKDVDLDFLARFFLHQEEIGNFYKIKNSTGRRQWLMGRVAAKDALRRYLAGPSERMVHPAGLIFEDGPAGRLFFIHTADSDCKILINVACSDLGAVAAASTEPLGVDPAKLLAEIENVKATG